VIRQLPAPTTHPLPEKNPAELIDYEVGCAPEAGLDDALA